MEQPELFATRALHNADAVKSIPRSIYRYEKAGRNKTNRRKKRSLIRSVSWEGTVSHPDSDNRAISMDMDRNHWSPRGNRLLNCYHSEVTNSHPNQLIEKSILRPGNWNVLELIQSCLVIKSSKLLYWPDFPKSSVRFWEQNEVKYKNLLTCKTFPLKK